MEIAEFAPTMGAEFAEWLLAKAEQEGWDKESVFEHLLMLNREGQIALAHFTDSSVYNKVAEVLGSVKMAEAASYMGAEFADWLLVKTDQEDWDKKTMYSGLIKKNDWGKTALAHFADISVWEKVAAEVGADIAKSASAMGPEFMEWLLVKTKEDGWNELQVYEELIKVNTAGKAALAHCTDTSFWNKVAVVVHHNVAKSAVAMPLVFTEWLVQKTEEEGWEKEKVYQLLCKATREHKTALSGSMPMLMWTMLSTWAPKKGLHFRVENNELAEALKTWYTTLVDVGEENEEEADLIRTLIEKKGVVVKLLGNSNQLESAVNGWNEKNKHMSE